MKPINLFLNENESFGYFMVVDLVGYSTNLFVEEKLYYSLKYGKFDIVIQTLESEL
jgi:hypothetical protein